MLALDLILLLLAAACFVAAAFGWAGAKVNLLALGLAFWVAVPLIAAVKAVT